MVLSRKEAHKVFPEDYSETDMEKVIEALLEQWKREQGIRVVKIRYLKEKIQKFKKRTSMRERKGGRYMDKNEF